MKYKNDAFKLCFKCKHKSKRLAYRISSANYKNNKCEICGLERNTIDDLDLFDFHHTDRSNKSFELGDKIEDRKWEDIKKELKPNSGSSLKDQVTRLEGDVLDLKVQNQQGERFHEKLDDKIDKLTELFVQYVAKNK